MLKRLDDLFYKLGLVNKYGYQSPNHLLNSIRKNKAFSHANSDKLEQFAAYLLNKNANDINSGKIADKFDLLKAFDDQYKDIVRSRTNVPQPSTIRKDKSELLSQILEAAQKNPQRSRAIVEDAATDLLQKNPVQAVSNTEELIREYENILNHNFDVIDNNTRSLAKKYNKTGKQVYKDDLLDLGASSNEIYGLLDDLEARKVSGDYTGLQPFSEYDAVPKDILNHILASSEKKLDKRSIPQHILDQAKPSPVKSIEKTPELLEYYKNKPRNTRKYDLSTFDHMNFSGDDYDAAVDELITSPYDNKVDTPDADLYDDIDSSKKKKKKDPAVKLHHGTTDSYKKYVDILEQFRSYKEPKAKLPPRPKTTNIKKKRAQKAHNLIEALLQRPVKTKIGPRGTELYRTMTGRYVPRRLMSEDLPSTVRQNLLDKHIYLTDLTHALLKSEK